MRCDKCKHYCWYYDWCDKWKCQVYARAVHSCFEEAEVDAKPKPITNADRIRGMTDEELAEYLDGVCHDLWQLFVKDQQKMWLDWLKLED